MELGVVIGILNFQLTFAGSEEDSDALKFLVGNVGAIFSASLLRAALRVCRCLVLGWWYYLVLAKSGLRCAK